MVSVKTSPGMTFLKPPKRSVSVYSLPGCRSNPFEKPPNVIDGEAAVAVILINTNSTSIRDVIALNDFFIISSPFSYSVRTDVRLYRLRSLRPTQSVPRLPERFEWLRP